MIIYLKIFRQKPITPHFTLLIIIQYTTPKCKNKNRKFFNKQGRLWEKPSFRGKRRFFPYPFPRKPNWGYFKFFFLQTIIFIIPVTANPFFAKKKVFPIPFSKKTDLKGFHSFPQTSFRGRARETPLFLKGGFPQIISILKNRRFFHRINTCSCVLFVVL